MGEYPSDMTTMRVEMGQPNGRVEERTFPVPPGWPGWTDPMRRDWARARCMEALDGVVDVTWSDHHGKSADPWVAVPSWDVDGNRM